MAIQFPGIDVHLLPEVLPTANGGIRQVQQPTYRNMTEVLRQMGLGVRMNMMTNSVEFVSADPAIPALNTPQLQLDAERGLINNCSLIGIRADANFNESLQHLASESAFHPMQDWLEGLTWGGDDHIGQLIDAIDTDNQLAGTYIENWLVQCVEGVCGWKTRGPKSLPHVLVLAGGQGVGKSHMLAQLGGRWLRGEAELHLNSTQSKDHQIEALRWPMVELAELDGIFRKADVANLKAFISRAEDSLRLPYARRATVRARMTSFCATVNDLEFLNDDTGSRRFWPINVRAIDWGHVIDREQLWAQAYHYWQQDSNFNLTADENALREKIAADVHTPESAVHELIGDYLRVHAGNASYPEVPMSQTQITAMLWGERAVSHPGFQKRVGAALRAHLGAPRKIEGVKRRWMFPENADARHRYLWPEPKKAASKHLSSIK